MTMIASQLSNRIGNDIARKRTQADKASQCEQPGSASETHQRHLLTSPIAGVKRKQASYSGALRSRNALAITETELKLIAAPAIIGLSSSPKNG
jgi:hypothetical protein